MKILYTNFHAGPGIGGHTVYIQRLAQALAPRHEIVVATPGTSALHRLAGEIPGVTAIAQEYPTRVPQMLKARGPLRRLLRDREFDLIHVNGSSDHRLALLAAMGSKRPAIVLTKHNDLPIGKAGAMVRAPGTDAVIAVCKHVANMLEQTPYRRCEIATIRNGIDVSFFSPMDAAAKPALRRRWFGDELAGRIVLGSNAGTDDYKGWLDLMRGLALLPAPVRERVHVALAGDALDPAAVAEVERLGLSSLFTYVGRLEDVRPFIASFDVGFVLSWRVETISFACREMMAMGIPVVVTRHAGLPENITEHSDGWIVPPRNPRAIADWVQTLVDGQWPLAEMGVRARVKSVRQFGLEPFIAATEAVYERAVRRRVSR